MSHPDLSFSGQLRKLKSAYTKGAYVGFLKLSANGAQKPLSQLSQLSQVSNSLLRLKEARQKPLSQLSQLSQVSQALQRETVLAART